MATSPSEPTPPASGSSRTRLGNYELIEVIGGGSEGQVYKACCVAQGVPGMKLGEIVALKRLRFSDDEDDPRRFQSQTQILRALNHPNIVDYKDSFVWREDELHQEVFCLVTEFLEGETLKSVTDRHPTGLPWERAKRILSQVLEALRYASRQVVHRDLKLSNIFVLENDLVKLIDFGIARRQDSGASVSAAGFRGTWDYMAPDFVREKSFRGDEQSDIFSFGVCAYHVLTGKLPFPALGNNPQIAYFQRWLDSSKSPPVDYRHPAFSVLSRGRTCIDSCLTINRDVRCQSFEVVAADFSSIKPRLLRHGKETYEYAEYLGKGGFGKVFRARRTSDGAEVAIKEMIAERHASRFVAEAKILQKTQHSHLIEYLDFFEVEEQGLTDQRKLFLVLEYLKGMPGASLRERIKTSETGLEPIEALRSFAGYLDCLQHLHGQGIIHRDIKPGNLYAPAGAPERAKIFDLGIAHDTEGTRTHGQVPGTFDYMPPEFATQNSSRGSPQSDIYSLGVTLYEALTKRLPFASVAKKNEAEAWVAFYQRSEKPVECSFEHPTFKKFPGLEQLIRRSLAHSSKQRYATAAQMRDEINEVLGSTFEPPTEHTPKTSPGSELTSVSEALPETPPGPSSKSPPGSPPDDPSGGSPESAPKRRQFWLWLLVSLIFALVLWLWFFNSSPRSTFWYWPTIVSVTILAILLIAWNKHRTIRARPPLPRGYKEAAGTGMNAPFLRLHEIKGKVDVGIITVRADEFRAVFERFDNRRPVLDGMNLYEYATVETDHGSIRVVICRCHEQGQGPAQTVTTNLLDDLMPPWIFLVGIAGAAPDNDYTLGDVIVANRVHDFSVTAALEGKLPELDVRGGPMHPHVQKLVAHLPACDQLIGDWHSDSAIRYKRPVEKIPEHLEDDGDASKLYYGRPDWRKKVHASLLSQLGGKTPRAQPKLWIAPSASGNQLMKDARLAKQWKRTARSVATIEMELGGAYQAVQNRGDGQCRLMGIRGISDVVGYTRNHEWTPYACQSAASFTYALLKSGILQTLNISSTNLH